MNKKLLDHYQRADQLSVEKKAYQDMLSELFYFFIHNDHVEEDLTSNTFLPHSVLEKKKEATIISKTNCVIAGTEEIAYLLEKHTKLTPFIKIQDGEKAGIGDTVLSISGSVSDILSYERTVLNILQRMSGIATETAKYVSLVKNVKNPPLIAATRKTPWIHLDKKAVAVGGGMTHRLDLRDGILLKDNHLAVLESSLSLRGESEAISYAIQHAKFQEEEVSVEVEVKTETAGFAAIESWQKLNRKNPFIILLDNFTPKIAASLIAELKNKFPKQEVFFEASGGVNIDNVREWAKTDVDVISIGAITHSPKAADLSMDIS